ncbi:MAG: ROK family protein [Desulfovibrionaceae bacterium]
MNNFHNEFGGSQRELRRNNRNRIFRALFASDVPISRSELVRITGLNLPVVSRVTNEMLLAGLLEEITPPPALRQRGRRVTLLAIKAEGAYVVTVAITAYSQELILGNLKGHIIYSREIPEFLTLQSDDLLHFLVENILRAVRRNKIPSVRLLGGCLAVPRHAMLFSDQAMILPILNSAFIEKLQTMLGIPMISIRLAEALNLAENNWGASKGFSNVLYLHLALIIGASVLHGGALLPSPDRFGNISSMPIATVGHAHGTLARIEDKASGISILRSLKVTSPQRPPGYTIQDRLNLSLAHTRAMGGDTSLQKIFMEAGQWMGYALETLYRVYNPEIILFGGSLVENSFYLNALQTTWQSTYPQAPPVETRVGCLPTASATILTALKLHVFSASLDLDPLLSGTGEDIFSPVSGELT